MNPFTFLENSVQARLGTALGESLRAALEQNEKTKKEDETKLKTLSNVDPEMQERSAVDPEGVIVRQMERAPALDPSIAILTKILQQEQEARRAEAAATREFAPEQLELDLRRMREQAALTEQAALRKSREKTAREIEKQTIQSWQAVTQAEINRDTAMGLGMLGLSYGSALPNPQIMKAAASYVQTAANSFKTPGSII